MSKQSMIARVARAFGASMYGDRRPWGTFDGREQDALRRGARAAIAAMREPTPDMISAAANTPGMAAVNALVLNVFARTGSDVLAGHNPVPLVQAWQAMIDAALADPTS